MFCPVGFVTIAELWKEFCSKYALRLSVLARKEYSNSAAGFLDEFGSPMDFCEDKFLHTLDDMAIFAADEKGGVFRLENNLDGGRSQLFRKMSVLESTLTARDPQEAGIDSYWLIKMGSGTFAPWPDTMGPSETWSRAYPVLSDQVKRMGQEPFHTLPIAFERSRFTIPDAAPPWAMDLIDEHYLPKVMGAFGGSALCLNLDQATRWRAKHISNSSFLRDLEPSSGAAGVGRPGKQDSARACYRQLFPNGHQGTLKAACQEIERTFGLVVAPKTLGRAINSAAPEASEPKT